MNNTVLIESKIKRKLKLASSLLVIFCLCFIFGLITVVMVERQNLSGQVDEVTGVLTSKPGEDSNTITLETDESKKYNVVWDKQKEIDWDKYQGKTVTLTVSRKAFLSANLWALGLSVDGETIVDYHETLESKYADNSEAKTVFIVVTAVLCVGTCGVFIWRFNVNPVTERVLYHEFAEFLTPRQPVYPKRKIITVCYLIVYFTLLTALFIAAAVIDPNTEELKNLSVAAKAVLWVLLAVAVSGFAGVFVLIAYLSRKEIDFYAENFPFDFSDISHAPIRKKYKEQLQQEILKDREEHPDSFADGGNGYDVLFDENGITLTTPSADDLISITPPQAEEVFGSQNSASGATENARALKLSYEELNFEAVAHFRKHNHPMMIIVKSRLTRKADFPEEFVNDVHIAFDINLYNTLKKFKVEVENLDYLLNNKKRLMEENCLKFHKKPANSVK